jgi:hypothetical protein
LSATSLVRLNPLDKLLASTRRNSTNRPVHEAHDEASGTK